MNETNPSPQPQTMRLLAAADPDFAPFAATHGGFAHQHLSPSDEAALVHDLAALFQQLPEMAQALQRVSAATRPGSFDAGIASVPLLLAAAFLLRTHLRIKRTEKGKWEFLAEHKPANSKLVSELLAKIADWLSK